MKRNGLWVPAGSFALAMLLSIVAGPTRLIIGRAFQDATSKPCKVTVTCDPQECTFPFNPAALTNATDADIKKLAGDALKSCQKSLGCVPYVGKKKTQGNVETAFNTIKSGAKSAQTVVSGFGVVGLTAEANTAPDKGGTATLSLCTIALALVPAPPAGSPNLSAHEAGHQSIHKHYRCDKEAKYLETELNKAVCSRTFSSSKELGDFIQTTAITLLQTFEQPAPDGVGPEDKYQGDFDSNTHDGMDDGEPAAANAVNGTIDTAAHTAFPGDFP